MTFMGEGQVRVDLKRLKRNTHTMTGIVFLSLSVTLFFFIDFVRPVNNESFREVLYFVCISAISASLIYSHMFFENVEICIDELGDIRYKIEELLAIAQIEPTKKYEIYKIIDKLYRNDKSDINIIARDNYKKSL